jgi:hypothetical protein
MPKWERAALFWTFLVLFIAIVAVALLVATNLGPFADASTAFETTAVGTVIAGIVGAVITVYRGLFTPAQSEQSFIALDFQGVDPADVDLVQQGTYQIWDDEVGKAVAQGTVIAEPGNGGWYCAVPAVLKPTQKVRLEFADRSGQKWEVRYFSLRFNKQPAVKR